MNRQKRHSYIVVALIFAAMMLVALSVIGLQQLTKTTDTSRSGQTIRVTGTALCLPHTDTSGPQTMECGIGILDGKGQYYALNDGDNNYRHISELPMNQKVTVEGTLEKVVDSIYPIKGTIHITKVER